MSYAKNTIISIFVIMSLLSCKDPKFTPEEQHNKKSTSRLKPYHRQVCKGYGHLVGPTKMYCISTEETTSKEKTKVPKKLNFLQPDKLDDTD